MLRALCCSVSLLACSFVPLAAQDKPKIKEVPPTPTSPASGKEMFRSYCAPCHGMMAKGDGPAAPALKKQPTDLTQLAAKNGGKFPAIKVYAQIEGDSMTPAHGAKGMPIWGDVFRSMTHNEGEIKMRINNLTRYVESLQVK
ncbi:MAG: cytochrome c [Acidobacteria bacterium]|nr:cytochrome c [Acidobacteriota bacterium]